MLFFGYKDIIIGIIGGRVIGKISKACGGMAYLAGFPVLALDVLPIKNPMGTVANDECKAARGQIFICQSIKN